MICIYREHYPGALETENGRSLSCKATWLEVNAINLRSAVLALKHHPWVGTTPLIQVRIDGVPFDIEQLPKDGATLLQRCHHWLKNFQRTQTKSAVPSPVFGL